MSGRAAAHQARWRRRAVAAAAALAATGPMAMATGATTASGAQPLPRTGCRAVAHIGDSLSQGMVSSAIADPDHRIEARYEAVGVQDVELEISGGRSVVEHLDDQEGGEAVARRLRREGFRGCWVVDLATNDAANVHAGSGYGYSERIDRMMAVIGDDPVMWVDTSTRKERGHYASENMRLFNQALEKAHARYPSLVVYEWSEAVQDVWFQGDGIHFTPDGSAYRAALIAGALAEAFPAGWDSPPSVD